MATVQELNDLMKNLNQYSNGEYDIKYSTSSNLCTLYAGSHPIVGNSISFNDMWKILVSIIEVLMNEKYRYDITRV